MTTRRQDTASRSRPAESTGDASSPVDQLLCAYAHRSEGFADYVLTELVRPSLRALAPALGVDVVALARHAAGAQRRRLRTQVLLATALAAAVVCLAWGVASASLPRTSLLIAACLLCALVAVGSEKILDIRAQSRLIDRGDVRTGARPLCTAIEQSLAELMDSNVVVYSGDDPFSAWGGTVSHVNINVDVTRAARDAQGNARPVKPIQPSDLYRAIHLAVRKASIPDLDVHFKILVDGRAVEHISALLPDPYGRPAPTVAPGDLPEIVDQHAADARTYLCLEQTIWGGEIRVSTFVRAVMTGSHLFLEYNAYAQPPLNHDIHATRDLPMGRMQLAYLVAVYTLRRTWRKLLASPVVIVHALTRDIGRRRQLAAARRAVRRRRPIDRGAPPSIRQAVSDAELSWHVSHDVLAALNTAQRLILNTVRDVLDNHGIATADIARYWPEATVTQIKIDGFHAANVPFGNANAATAPATPRPAGAVGAAVGQQAASPAPQPSPKGAGLPEESRMPAPDQISESTRAGNPDSSAWRQRLEKWLLLPLSDQGARSVAIYNYEQRLAAIMNALGDPDDRPSEAH